MFSTMLNFVKHRYPFASYFNVLNNYLSLFTNTFYMSTTLFSASNPYMSWYFIELTKNLKNMNLDK